MITMNSGWLAIHQTHVRHYRLWLYSQLTTLSSCASRRHRFHIPFPIHCRNVHPPPVRKQCLVSCHPLIIFYSLIWIQSPFWSLASGVEWPHKPPPGTGQGNVPFINMIIIIWIFLSSLCSSSARSWIRDTYGDDTGRDNSVLKFHKDFRCSPVNIHQQQRSTNCAEWE